MSKKSKEAKEVKALALTKLEAIFWGGLVTIAIAILSTLISSFFDNFVTYAKYNEDKAVWSTVLEKVSNIEEDIKEIKGEKKPFTIIKTNKPIVGGPNGFTN